MLIHIHKLGYFVGNDSHMTLGSDPSTSGVLLFLIPLLSLSWECPLQASPTPSPGLLSGSSSPRTLALNPVINIWIAVNWWQKNCGPYTVGEAKMTVGWLWNRRCRLVVTLQGTLRKTEETPENKIQIPGSRIRENYQIPLLKEVSQLIWPGLGFDGGPTRAR